MVNEEYLKKHGLYDAHKHFMHLSEAYVPVKEVMGEAGEEDMQGGDPNMGGGDPGMGGGAPMDPGMGGDPGMGTDPSMASGDPNMGGDPSMGGAPMDQGMGGDPNMAGGDPTMGTDPNMGADPSMGGAPMDPDMGGDFSAEEEDDDYDATIDIDTLTKSEEKLAAKQDEIGRDLSKVDGRIIDLMKSLDTFKQMVDSNNEKIEALKKEFERRNPTQTEKLNLRSLDSYPFKVNPKDYWAEEAKKGGYQAYSDNNEPTAHEYVITNNDVKDVDDTVANTFFNIDSDDIQTLDKIFRL
jgi:hypothetical protein